MHRGDVVLAVDALDHEAAVLALAGQAVLEDHHRGDHLGALEVGDVVALDPQRHLGQLERLLDLLERLVAGGQVAGPLGLVQHQRLAGVAGDGLLERLLVAALRHPDRAPGCRAGRRAAPRASSGVRRQRRDQDLARDRVAAGLAGVELEQEVLDQLGRCRPPRPGRPPSRAGRGSGRRARRRSAPRPRAGPRPARSRRRRCRRRAPPPASPAPG